MDFLPTLNKASSRSSLWLGVTAVAAGTAAAAMHGNLEIIPLSICLLFGVAAQLTINFLHRYNDERYHFGENEADGISFEGSSFSALSVLREAMLGACLVTLMIGLTIVVMGGWEMMVFGVILTLLAVLLNFGKHPLSRTPWGVGLTSIAFGPIGTVAVCFLQSQRESVNEFNWFDLGPAVWFGCAVGFLIGNWKILYNYANYDLDIANHKNTLSVMIGRNASRVMIVVNAICCLAVIAVFVLKDNVYPQWALITLPALAVLFYIYVAIAMKNADDAAFHRLSHLCGFVMVALMSGIFLIFCFTGDPVDSHLMIFGKRSMII